MSGRDLAEYDPTARTVPDSEVLRRFGGCVRPYVRHMAAAFVLVVLVSAATLAQPYLLRIAIDDGIQKGDLGALNRVAILYLATLIVFWVATYGQTYVLSWVGQRVLLDLRSQLFAHLQRLSLRFYDRETIGRIISRLTSDVSALNEVLTQGLIHSVADVFMLLGTVGIMFTMSPRLTLVTFTILPLMYAIAKVFAKYSRRAYRRIRVAIADVNAALAEGIVGMKTVQAFRREEYNADQFNVVNVRNLEATKGAIAWHSGLIPILDLLDAISTALLLWVGGRWILGADAAELTIGVLTAFILYMARFFEPIRDLSSRYDTLQAALAAGERIFGLLDTQPELRDRPGAYDLPMTKDEGRRTKDEAAATEEDLGPSSFVVRPAGGHVVFDRVTFGYDPEHPVLDGVSFEARPGERIALVGRTGAGKSTIIRLLMRFYDIQGGRILVDGHDVRDVTQTSLRRQMSLVLQEPFLFSGTVRENIAYGKPDASLAEVIEASQAVGLHDFIAKLPDGYDSVVEERGGNLSGGQRQLVSIARAFLTNPRILILDEATSSVDTQTEQIVQSALDRLLHGRTAFIIAHRLSTVKNATRILVLDRGRIVEQGTHKELLELEGYYYRLYTLGLSPNEDELLARAAEEILTR